MSREKPGITLTDLQTVTLPQFGGISGTFFEGSATFINYAVPVNQSITKTPQNKAGVAKMQQILRKVSSQQRQARFGDSMLTNEMTQASFLDQTSNNQTIVREYGKAIIEDLIKTDAEYLRSGLYGDPDYLDSVQINNVRNVGVGLCVEPSRAASSQSASRRGAMRSAGSQRASQTDVQQKTRLSPNEIVQQKDVLKGVDYICQVVFKESYTLETQFFAAGLFHRIMSKLQIKRSELKLLAALCVFEATKYEENFGEALGSSALVAYFGEAFTVKQLMTAEQRFMETLDWRLGVSSCNARVYLRTLFRDLGLQLPACVLASYLAEISLLEQRFLGFAGFEVALASVELALLSLYLEPINGFQLQKGHPLLTKVFLMTQAANVDAQRVLDAARGSKSGCRKQLSMQWIEISAKGTATQIYKKYCDPAYFAVATRKPVEDPDIKVLEIVEKL